MSLVPLFKAKLIRIFESAFSLVKILFPQASLRKIFNIKISNYWHVLEYDNLLEMKAFLEDCTRKDLLLVDQYEKTFLHYAVTNGKFMFK